MEHLTEKATQYLGSLRESLAKAYARRSRHICFINAILFCAEVVVIASIIFAIVDPRSTYGTLTMSVGAIQALALIFVILGLIVHGMSLGRMTSMMVGVLRSSIDMLVSEIRTLSADALPQSEISETLTGHVNQPLPSNFGETTAKNDRLKAANTQVESILSELESTGLAVQTHVGTTDMAVFSYGFATLCLLSTGVLALGTTSHAEYLRILILSIGTVCAMACYAVLARPTNPQFLVEQSLRKLGLSVEALTDSMRARNGNLPALLDEHEVFEPIGQQPELEHPADPRSSST